LPIAVTDCYPAADFVGCAAMRVRLSAIGSGLGLGLLLLGGCAYGEVRQVVRAQFATEFDCPEVLLKKRELWYSYEGPDQFKAIGCGRVRTYTCPKSGLVSYDEPVCTFVEGDADAPKMAEMTPEGEEDIQPPPDDLDMGGTDETSGDEAPPPADDSGSSDDGDGEGGGDLGGDLDAEADADADADANAEGGGGSGKVGGGAKIKLGVGKKK
jgi:hypothetical protein